jgi:hypothetical protein
MIASKDASEQKVYVEVRVKDPENNAYHLRDSLPFKIISIPCNVTSFSKDTKFN